VNPHRRSKGLVMNRATGPSDYRSSSEQPGFPGMAEDMTERMSEAGQQIGSFASDVASAVKERPYTALAAAAGLAFAVGALWMVRRNRQPSSYGALLARLPSLPDMSALPDRGSLRKMWQNHWG
jgi:hypothetical protein